MSAGTSWWRRNWWALVATLPVLVAVVLLSPTDPYQTWRDSEPRQPVAPGPDGWASYAGTRVRLAGFGPADLRDPGTGQPFQLPAGLRAWQATVTFGRLTNPDETLLLCELALADEAGRRFGDGPEQVSDARLGPGGEPYLQTSCRPREEQAEAPTFEVVALFVLPSSAQPVALRLTAADQLPDYVRFELGSGAVGDAGSG